MRSVDLPGALPSNAEWAEQAGQWVSSKRGWQIAVARSDRVEPGDVPEEVMPLLPGIEFLTRLHLEPISAPGSAHTLLSRVARSLARDAHGVVFDPQAGSAGTPPGVKRLPGRGRAEVFAALEFNWWFLDGPLLADGGVSRLVGALESLLPEALPKRYGEYEPPQFRYDAEGRAHFEDFLAENMGTILVWYPSRPVAGIWIDARPGDGLTRWGFTPSTFSITVEASVLEMPGWEVALRRLWREVSLLIRPFYGDVRTLRGYLRAGATYSVTAETEQHPVDGPRWNGVPRTLGHAAVLGPPYQDAWPEFQRHADSVDGLWFGSTPAWADPTDFVETCGSVPDGVAQPIDRRRSQERDWRPYPDVWPLPGPPVPPTD